MGEMREFRGKDPKGLRSRTARRALPQTPAIDLAQKQQEILSYQENIRKGVEATQEETAGAIRDFHAELEEADEIYAELDPRFRSAYLTAAYLSATISPRLADHVTGLHNRGLQGDFVAWNDYNEGFSDTMIKTEIEISMLHQQGYQVEDPSTPNGQIQSKLIEDPTGTQMVTEAAHQLKGTVASDNIPKEQRLIRGFYATGADFAVDMFKRIQPLAASSS